MKRKRFQKLSGRLSTAHRKPTEQARKVPRKSHRTAWAGGKGGSGFSVLVFRFGFFGSMFGGDSIPEEFSHAALETMKKGMSE
jgi:hypothetical protein